VLRRGPVALEPTIQAGNAAANPFQLPSGTVYSGQTAVAVFTVNSNGSVQVTPLGGAPPALAGGVLDPASATLKLNWIQLPAESSVVITYYYDAFRPGYPGPDDAFETPRHIMASPASVGSRIEDALASVYLGERELIKLAFADASQSVQERVDARSARPCWADRPATWATAAIGGCQSPPASAAIFGRQIQVEAINVVGPITLRQYQPG
jgi:hypothetical protein